MCRMSALCDTVLSSVKTVKMKGEKYITDLLLRYCDGETEGQETRRVERWMAASGENRRKAARLRALLMAADVSSQISDMDVERALKLVHRRMGERGRTGLRRWGYTLQRVAAVLFIPIVIIASLQFFNRNRVEDRMLEFRTDPGMTASAKLPDGSRVVLNSSSVLRYPAGFGSDERKVELEGEAFFSVVKGKRPFVVNVAGESSIRVYGTEFNVVAEEGGSRVSTTLVKGKVGFSYLLNGKRKEWVMHPGEKLVYDKAGQSVSLAPADVEVETCWKDGRLIFKDTPFEEVLEKLGKRYDVKFVLKNPSLEHHSFTANFGRQRLERLMEYFQVASGIRFKYVDDAGGTDTERPVIEVY